VSKLSVVVVKNNVINVLITCTDTIEVEVSSTKAKLPFIGQVSSKTLHHPFLCSEIFMSLCLCVSFGS
jgi:hypothetical protein